MLSIFRFLEQYHTYFCNDHPGGPAFPAIKYLSVVLNLAS